MKSQDAERPRVSLTKPGRTSSLREITPEHISSEPTVFVPREFSPEHISAEIYLSNSQVVSTPQKITSSNTALVPSHKSIELACDYIIKCINSSERFTSWYFPSYVNTFTHKDNCIVVDGEIRLLKPYGGYITSIYKDSLIKFLATLIDDASTIDDVADCVDRVIALGYNFVWLQNYKRFLLRMTKNEPVSLVELIEKTTVASCNLFGNIIRDYTSRLLWRESKAKRFDYTKEIADLFIVATAKRDNHRRTTAVSQWLSKFSRPAGYLFSKDKYPCSARIIRIFKERRLYILSSFLLDTAIIISAILMLTGFIGIFGNSIDLILIGILLGVIFTATAPTLLGMWHYDKSSEYHDSLHYLKKDIQSISLEYLKTVKGALASLYHTL